MDPRAADVLQFWLGDDPVAEIAAHAPRWFASDEATDAEIRARFGELHAAAARGELAAWADTPRGRLALVIVLDQFSRNLCRGDGAQFANDPTAQALAREGLEAGDAETLDAVERLFLLMPLMHAEQLALQDESCERFARLADAAPEPARATCQSFADYARRHRAVIARFGRFPHRNELLGRVNSDAEAEHLARGERF